MYTTKNQMSNSSFSFQAEQKKSQRKPTFDAQKYYDELDEDQKCNFYSKRLLDYICAAQLEAKTSSNPLIKAIANLKSIAEIENVITLNPGSLHGADDFGNAPLHVAVLIRVNLDYKNALIALLKQYGCKLFEKNSYKMTPTHLAVKLTDKETYKLLVDLDIAKEDCQERSAVEENKYRF